MRRISLVLACLIVVLVVVNIILVETNRGVQQELGERGQFIQQSAQFENLNREMVNALANLAVQNNDDQLRAVLAQQGITINPGGASAAGRAPAAAPPAGAPGGKR